MITLEVGPESATIRFEGTSLGQTVNVTLDDARDLLGLLEERVPPVDEADAVEEFSDLFGEGVTFEESISGPMCALCNMRVQQADPEMHVEVIGWQRAHKGTSVKHRSSTGSYAHGSCVERLRKGGQAQGSLT